ncbi:hypothetical protein [Streptomyces antimycoticus]|uniref:hypothetical protein n=1 Tax=Streptomyces antimycoticus TaxID=68175 RepID=UPI0036E05149
MGRSLDEDGRSVGIVPLLHPHGPGPSDTSLAVGLDLHTVQATVAASAAGHRGAADQATEVETYRRCT